MAERFDRPPLVCPSCGSSYVGHLAIADDLGHNVVCLACEFRWRRGGRVEKKARNRRRWTLRRHVGLRP